MKYAPPIIHALSVPKFKLPAKETLDNGIDLYKFQGTTPDITRVDFVFDSGMWAEKYPLIAQTTALLLKSGTKHKTAFQISEAIEHLGSSVKIYSGYHGFNICVYTLKKNLHSTLQLVYECITESIFPEDEFANLIRLSLPKQVVQEGKNEFVAERAFKNAVWGRKHPYGYSSEIAFIQQLQLEDIRQYYKEQILSCKPTILVSGDFQQNEIHLLNTIFGKIQYKNQLSHFEHFAESSPDLKQKITQENGVQTSIYMGKVAINKLHPDYAQLSMTNTIFGGYFGSRLMSNIRESKGYTYGIYSSLITYRHGGMLQIQTETSHSLTTKCVKEIITEIKKLQNDFVQEEELRPARNYLLGKYLSRMDGAFAQMEIFKNYLIEGVEIEYFNKFAQRIQAISKENIQEMAQKFLNFEDMYQITVGEK